MTPPASRRDRAGWVIPARRAPRPPLGLARIAGAISHRHLRQPAAHGNTGWHAYTFPLSVDGVEIAASLILLADRRPGRRSPP